MTTKNSTLELQDATQGKYFQIDFRNVRPLDLAGGNVRTEYPKILELSENILDMGSIEIDGKLVRFNEASKDIAKDQWKKHFAGKLLRGGIITELKGYSKEVDGTRLYFTMAGHRRTKACQMIFDLYGIVTIIPFIPKDVRGMSEKDILIFMLNENQNRVGLDLVEQAQTAKRLIDQGCTIGEVAIAFNKKGAYNFVKNLLKLESAPAKIKELVKSKTISMPAMLALLEKSEDEKTLLFNLEQLMTQTTNAAIEKNGKAPAKIKIKSSHVKPPAQIDSKLEIGRFFKKHGDKTPAFKTEQEAAIFSAYAMVFKNQVTLAELDKQFFPQ